MMETIAGWIFNALKAAWGFITGFLAPLNPLRDFLDDAVSGEVLRMVHWANWFIDLGFFVKGLGLLLGALAVWYAVQALLRWVKVIE